MSDHIDRAAEVIDSCALGDKGIRIIGSDHYPSINVARALDIAGLLVTPAHDAAVAAKALREASEALKAESTEWHGEDMRHHSGEPSDCECSDDGLCHEYARFTALNGRAPIWLRERADRIEREGGSDV